MGLLTSSYEDAMQLYKSLLTSQKSINDFSNSLAQSQNIVVNDTTINMSTSNRTEDLEEAIDGFKNMLSNAISDVDSPTTSKTPTSISSSGKAYGYSIHCAALEDERIVNKIKKLGIDKVVSLASEKYGIPEIVIYKVIETESYFNENAVSGSGAVGLMQIMPFNNASLGISNAKDIYQNIMGGTKLLKQYLDMHNGNLKLGLASYNAGPGNVRKYGNTVPPFKETQNYIRKILNVEP